MEERLSPTLDRAQKLQVDEWLRQADKLIREGRYLAADEALQKVFAIHPQNEVALSYQDRIQFLIKQLSQRTGLRQDIHAEIRRYRDLVVQRKTNQISSLLVTAQKMLDDKYFKKAVELANKVLALDPENMYAKALIQRIEEVQKRSGESLATVERESKYCAILRESWRNGRPTDAQQAILKRMRDELSITGPRGQDLERDVRNTLYKEALHEVWLTGGISAFAMADVDALRTRLEISRTDHSLIEAAMLREVRKNRIKGTVMVVGENEADLLEMAKELRESYFAVIAAGNCDEALACLKTVIPNVIVAATSFQSDSVGFDLFQSIRSTAATKHLPFIFVTPTIDNTTLLIGKRLGVDEFMNTPVDYDLLVATITGKLRRGPEAAPQPKRPVSA